MGSGDLANLRESPSLHACCWHEDMKDLKNSNGTQAVGFFLNWEKKHTMLVEVQ